MLDKQCSQLIYWFVNNQLKDRHLINDFNIYPNINLILEQIKLYSKFHSYTKIQILQQLIVDTSKNSPELCIEFILFYCNQYSLINNPFYAWDILKDITQYALKNNKNIADINHIHRHYIFDISDVRDYYKKYFYFRSNNDNDIDIKKKIKLVFIILHKMYYMFLFNFNKMQRKLILIPEAILGIFKYYVTDFQFSLKDQRLFANILVDILIKIYLDLKRLNETKPNCYKFMCPWEIYLDFIFSNWQLLYTRHKYFFNINGKEIIELFYQQKLDYCIVKNSKEIFLRLNDKLN